MHKFKLNVLINGEVYRTSLYRRSAHTNVHIDSIDLSAKIYFSFSILLIDESSRRVYIVLRSDILQLTIVGLLQLEKDPFVTSDDLVQQASSVIDRLIKIRSFLSSKRIPFQEKAEPNGVVVLLIHNGVVQIIIFSRLSSIVL
jgi:hypothetical protein